MKKENKHEGGAEGGPPHYPKEELSLCKKMENSLNLMSLIVKMYLGRPIIHDAFQLVKWYAIFRFLMFY